MRQSGFSLVELMVAVAILGILSAVAVPSMQNLIAESRLSAQVDVLVAGLNQARTLATSSRKAITVCGVADPNTATACGSDWANGFIIYDGSAVLYRQGFKDVQVTVPSSAPVVFSKVTGALVNEATLKVCARGLKERIVSVKWSGRVSKQQGSSSC